MKLLGSVRFITPAILEALEIAKRRKDEQTHDRKRDEVENNIEKLYKAKFEYEIFKTHNAYITMVGDARFAYHDELKIELITTGRKGYNIKLSKQY